MFEDRAEFVSEKWVGLARDYLQGRVDALSDRVEGARFSLCEVMATAPAGFRRRAGLAAWHARLDGRRLTVGLGEIADADLTIRGDYHAVLQAARVSYDDDGARRRGLREAQHRNGGRPVASMAGTGAAGVAAEVFAGLHDHLAARTVENPDLDERIERLGLAAAARQLDETGYVILERAVSDRFADDLRAAIIAAAEAHGQAQAGMLLERGRIFEETALHPWLYALGEKLCGKGFLLGQLLGLRKQHGPGEIGLHTDYVGVREPFPAQAQMCTAIWALEDFTAAAGSTWVVPNSHRLKRHPRPSDDLGGAIPLEMPKGSIAIWDGALWHWQGGRELAGERVTLHTTYMQGTMRPYDDYLHIDPAILARNPPELSTLAAQDDVFGKNNHAGQQRHYFARSMALRREAAAERGTVTAQ
jgi:ectoine hydroxylase-related dioxygenase (phytanoyl-CoA dioxygenase family)